MDRDRAIEILRDMSMPEYGHIMDEHQAAKAGADALVRLHSIEQELEEARKDTERLDYLEMEMEYERRRIDHGVALELSLFRRNMPITRKKIDEMRGLKP